MKKYTRKISKEVYERSLKHHGYIDDTDFWNVFTAPEIMGYGVYGEKTYEKDGEYFVAFEMGDSCD